MVGSPSVKLSGTNCNLSFSSYNLAMVLTEATLVLNDIPLAYLAGLELYADVLFSLFLWTFLLVLN